MHAHPTTNQQTWVLCVPVLTVPPCARPALVVNGKQQEAALVVRLTPKDPGVLGRGADLRAARQGWVQSAGRVCVRGSSGVVGMVGEGGADAPSAHQHPAAPRPACGRRTVCCCN